MSGQRRTLEVIRLLEAEGWTFTRTRGGHWRGTHPDAVSPLFMASTASDHKARDNALAVSRRLRRRNDRP